MAQQVVMCLAALRLALRARRLAVPERRCREQHTARASGGRMSTVLNALYDRRGCDSFCFPALCPAAFGGFTYVRPLSLGVSSRSLGLRRVPSMAITVRHADTLAVCPCVCLAPLAAQASRNMLGCALSQLCCHILPQLEISRIPREADTNNQTRATDRPIRSAALQKAGSVCAGAARGERRDLSPPRAGGARTPTIESSG